MKKHRIKYSALLLGFAALLIYSSGCPDEKKIFRPVYPQAGSLEFAAAKAVDGYPAVPGSQVTFDKNRMVSYGGNERALIAYVSDDGSGTSRLSVIRFDKKNNPIAAEFRAPEKFDANTGDVADAMIRMDRFGDGLLVWTQVSGSINRLFASIYTGSTDSFSFPRVVDYTPDGENAVPEGVDAFDIALDADGNGMIGFYENSASPCEAFGVYYDKSLRVFNAPEKIGLFGSEAGHPFSKIMAEAGPAGAGALSFLQDTDSGAGQNDCAAGSKFSSESSLSSFSAPIRVNDNTPPFDNPVREVDLSCLPNGDLLWLIEQNDGSGNSRVLYRRMDGNTGAFEEASPVDIALNDATSDFAHPALVNDPFGNAIALFLRETPGSPALYYNIFNSSLEAFSTGGPYPLSTAGGAVEAGFMLSFDSSGNGEAGYVQSNDASGASKSVWAARYTAGITAFETPRRIDPGNVETGELSAMPLAFSSPEITGITFAQDGRAFISFTLSDGRLSRLYVSRSELADLKKFGEAFPVDGAFHNSVFSSTAQQVINRVEPGSGRFYLNPSDGSGFAAMLQRETFGAGADTVRLWACSYNGFNPAPDTLFKAACIADGFLDASSARDVSSFDAAGSAAGKSATAYVQNNGTTDELYVKYGSIAGGGQDWSSNSMDNGTMTSPASPGVKLGSDGAGFVLFAQDNGTGIVQLYARRINSSGVSNVGTTPVPGANEPISFTTASYMSVAGFSFELDASGRACVAFLQNKAAGQVCAAAVRIDPSGLVTGPIELSSPAMFSVQAPSLALASDGSALVLHVESVPATLKSNYYPSSSLFGATAAAVTADVESSAGPVNVVSLAAGGNLYLAAFEQDDGVGLTICARRHMAGAWEGSAPLTVSGPASASKFFSTPNAGMCDSGGGMIAFTENITNPVPAVNLMAAVLRPATGQFSTPEYIDSDNGAAGYPALNCRIGMNRSTGRGAVAFIQIDDAGLERIYTRGFDLAQGAAGLPAFDSHASDRNEGGAVVSTRVISFSIEIDRTGRGVLLHSELAVSADPDLSRAFLFARTYRESTASFGQAVLACRMMNTGTGGPGSGSDAEISSSGILVPGGSGDFAIVHTVDQNHQTNGNRTRLFASGVTIK